VTSDERQRLKEILNNLASILIMSGCSAEDLAREFATVCRQLKGRRPTEPMSCSSKIDHAQIISQWYRDPEYLDPAGKPRKLAFAGAQPSLTGLISRVLPGASPRGILDSLLELRAVRHSAGRYEPTGIQVKFDGNRAQWAYWNMKALQDVLQGMVHNYTCGPEQQFLAKAARHPRIPISELPAFHARIKRRALRFLNDVDAGMQRLERPGGQEQTTETGVLMFSFENPIRSSAGGSTTGKRAPRKSPRIVAAD
jgi:hypothetical protein